MTPFDSFLSVFPKEVEHWRPVHAAQLTAEIREEFHVRVPQLLIDFWEQIGSGYFGNRELFFFGDRDHILARESLVEWNMKRFWPSIYPAPRDGGPLFFAETCFGDQLGFRWKDNKCLFILFVIDSFESFVVAMDSGTLISEVLSDRLSLVEPDRLLGVQKELGVLPPGMHYAPIISPLMGGGVKPADFHLETPDVHFFTAIAAFEAVRGSE